MRSQKKFAKLVGMRHAARLQNVQGAVALATQFNGANEQPGIHDGGDLHVGFLDGFPPEVRFVRKPVTSRCFRKSMRRINNGVCVAQVASLDQAADRIDHDDLRLEVVNNLVNDRQVHLKTEERGPAGMKLKQVFLAPLGEVDADRLHVSHELPGRFLEGKINATFPPAAGGIDKLRGQTGFAGSRSSETRTVLPR